VAILTLRNGSIVVSEAGIPAKPAGSAFRSYVETTSTVQPGVAIANPNASSATVRLELTSLDGAGAGLIASVSLPANGQTAMFLNNIPGFQSIGNSFRGPSAPNSSSPNFMRPTRPRTS
jgi:hypothetical protein